MKHKGFPKEHHAYVAFRAEDHQRFASMRAGTSVYSTPVGYAEHASEETMIKYVKRMADNEHVADTVLIARYELVEVKEVKIR